MELTIQYADGTEKTVGVKPADLVAFERKFGLSWDEVQASPRVEHVFFMGWNATRRTGATTLGFDEWLDTVDDLDREADAPLETPSV